MTLIKMPKKAIGKAYIVFEVLLAAFYALIIFGLIALLIGLFEDLAFNAVGLTIELPLIIPTSSISEGLSVAIYFLILFLIPLLGLFIARSSKGLHLIFAVVVFVHLLSYNILLNGLWALG